MNDARQRLLPIKKRVYSMALDAFLMSAIRKLAAEGADNGLLAPVLAAGIARVKSAKSVGIRSGNWLSECQAQSLLNAPDTTTLQGLRDRAILAVLLGCGLRRSEVAALTPRLKSPL
jgi:site-specific recombinase XerC